MSSVPHGFSEQGSGIVSVNGRLYKVVCPNPSMPHPDPLFVLGGKATLNSYLPWIDYYYTGFSLNLVGGQEAGPCQSPTQKAFGPDAFPIKHEASARNVLASGRWRRHLPAAKLRNAARAPAFQAAAVSRKDPDGLSASICCTFPGERSCVHDVMHARAIVPFWTGYRPRRGKCCTNSRLLELRR